MFKTNLPKRRCADLCQLGCVFHEVNIIYRECTINLVILYYNYTFILLVFFGRNTLRLVRFVTFRFVSKLIKLTKTIQNKHFELYSVVGLLAPLLVQIFGLLAQLSSALSNDTSEQRLNSIDLKAISWHLFVLR